MIDGNRGSRPTNIFRIDMTFLFHRLHEGKPFFYPVELPSEKKLTPAGCAAAIRAMKEQIK